MSCHQDGRNEENIYLICTRMSNSYNRGNSFVLREISALDNSSRKVSSCTGG